MEHVKALIHKLMKQCIIVSFSQHGGPIVMITKPTPLTTYVTDINLNLNLLSVLPRLCSVQTWTMLDMCWQYKVQYRSAALDEDVW